MPSTDRPPAIAIAVALAIVYVVWGSTYFAIAVALETLPPLLFAAVRFLVAGGLLFGWAWLRRAPGTPAPTWRNWRAAAVVGGLLLLGGNGLVTIAEQYISSGLAALLVATAPLWMVVIGAVFFAERLRPAALVGLLVGFAGVGLLVAPGTAGFHLGGALIVLAAALFWASGSLWSRRARLHPDPLLATASEMIAGGALIAVVSVGRGELAALDLGGVSTASLLAVAYLIVFGSIVAFTAYTWLLRAASTSLVGTYAYVNPVVAVGLGWMFLSEPVTGRMLLAGGIVLAAVALIVTARAPRGSVAAPSAVPPVEAAGPAAERAEPPAGAAGHGAAATHRPAAGRLAISRPTLLARRR